MQPLIEAGYLIVKTVPRADWLSAELLPQQILSASPDIGPQFPGDYALTWCDMHEADRTEAFELIGLATPLHHSAMAWATEKFGTTFGWPAVFYDLPGAMAAREHFLAEVPGIQVIGLGLPDHHLALFLEAAKPIPPSPGFAGLGPSGYYEVANRRRPLALGGQFLGFELLDTEYGQNIHSWLCNHLEDHCFRTLGVRPAANGLLPDLETAERCCTEISRDDVAEPGLWLPWALVGYT